MNDTLGTSFPLLFSAGLLCGLGLGSLFWTRRLRRLSHQQDDLHRTALLKIQHEADSAHTRSASLLERLAEPYKKCDDPFDLRDLGEALLQTATALLPGPRSAFLAFDTDSRLLEGLAANGLSVDQLRALTLRPGEGLCGGALQTGKILHVENSTAAVATTSAERFLQAPYLVIPLRTQGAAKGVLALSYDSAATASALAGTTAQLLQGYGGVLLDSFKARQQNASAEGELIQGLLRCVEAKDRYTHQHLERTAYIARTFAREIRLPRGIVHQIEIGALLHDVGKIGIPDAILGKPSALTPTEYNEIKKHPEIGFRIMRPYSFLRGAAYVIYYHQEWFNGNGYPQGLAREEIPLGARLVSIIDAWDAMTSNRPYRAAMPRAAAIAELRRHAGTQFDPQLIDPFIATLERMEKEGIPTTESEAVAVAAHVPEQ